MIQRCTNPKNKEFKNYGARGIIVCERWRTFDNFLADMGEKPIPKDLYSIDRYPNNDGNYEPSNVRWATRKEQANNTRTSRGPMAKSNAERQRDFVKRNRVVLTAPAEVIAKKLGAMADRAKLRKVVTLLLRQVRKG